MNEDLRKYFDAQFSTLKTDLSTEIGEVSESVKLLANHVDKRFDAAEKRFDTIETRLDSIDENLTLLNRNTHNHEKRIAFIEESLPKLA